MKILWISHLLPYPPKGGVMQRSYNLLFELCKYNDVDFLTFYQKAHHTHAAHTIQLAKNKLGEFCNVVDVLPVPSDQSKFRKVLNMVAGLLTNKPYMVWWLKSKKFQKAFADSVEGKDYDVYYFDTLGLAQYLKILSQKQGATVLNHHNIESQLIHRRAEKEKNILKSLYFSVEAWKRKKFEKNICPLFDHNMVVSGLDKKRLQQIAGNLPCSVVANGVDLAYFKPTGRTQKGYRIIFIGGLTFYPNIEAIRFILKEIWPALKSRLTETEFYIVGRNPPEDIKRLSQFDSSIVVTGFVDDIRPLMEEATVYVCPITDGGGTRLKVLDALAMEKALVAHPIACEGIDVSDGKNVLLASTPQQFVESIIKLFNNNELRKKLGENGRKLILEKYSYKSIGDNFHNILLNMAHKKFSDNRQ